EAIEKINDAASQYGRAVNKDPSRRDWLLQWRDTLLRTIPETDVEYRKQYVERYAAALDRLATLDPTAPGPQLEQVLVQEERFRLGTGPDSMQAIADLVTRRIAALPDDSPTAIRLDAIRGLAVTDRAGRESVDGEDLDAALGAMRRFYDAFVESPDGFLQPVPPDLDEAGRSRFVRRARADHDRIGLGIVRWHMTQRDIAQSEGRTQDGVEALARAESILADMIGEGRRHESNARFHALAILIDLLQARDSIIGPAERRAEELRIFEQYAPVVIELLGASEASDLPGNEMLIFVSWFTDDVSRGALADEFERSVVAAPGDPTVLGRAARAMRAMGNLERSIELYAAIRELPRPELSLEGLLLPDAKTSAAFAQVEVNLDLRDIALGQGRSNEADAFLAAAREARDALASEGGVRAVGPVLRANAEVAIAEGKSLQAIRLLEEYRAEFGDSSIEVLIQLANLLLEQGTIGEAKSIIEPLVDAQIVNAQGAILLASIYREEGDLGRALQLLEDQARKSASPEEFAEAIARYRQVIAIEGGDTSGDASLDALVRARAAFARRDVEAASGILDELERDEPAAASSPQVILLRVDIANATGDKAGAVAILEQALQQDPDSDVLARVLRLLTSDDRVQLQVDEIEASDLSSIDKELAKY
ncbi:MAG: hypothetical protein MK142_03195, partial [Pseudomonadales bacterium]|nr:hypothetical protein [Pseudomonadales bacterium]